jgi:hypothetical protein
MLLFPAEEQRPLAVEAAAVRGLRSTAVIIAWTSADRGRGAARSGFFGPHEGLFSSANRRRFLEWK